MLLLDEPLAALDAKLREEMQIELINLQKEVGITFVYVTHDQTEALALSHRIAVMNKGRVEQVDEPSRLYGFPRTRFVADFIGTCNLLRRPRRASARAAWSPSTSAGLGPVRASTQTSARASGARRAIALRPEKIRSPRRGAGRTRDNRFAGTVHRSPVSWATSRSTASHARAARTIEALLANSGAGRAQFFEVGDAVELSWPADAGHFIERADGRRAARVERVGKWLVSGPPLLYLLVFFAVPALIMVLASFRTPGEFGGLAPLVDEDGKLDLNLESYARFFTESLYCADLPQVVRGTRC